MASSLPAPADAARSVEDTAELVLARTRSRGFVGVLTACFGLTEAWLVHSGRFIHDEGLLTWLYASYLSRDPVATLFFLKAKPALAALNLPGSAFGLTGFYAGHVIIACAGVVATAAAARAARIREWGIAALLCACSPGYLFGTAAGFSNVDAAALTALVLWMIFRRATPGFGTALVLSLLPWIRFEAAVFVVVTALALLARDRNPRFLAGLVALPLSYLSAGAVWHHDLLWFLHYPAAFAQIADTGVLGTAVDEVSRFSVADAAFAVITVTPAIGLALVPTAGGAPRWVPVGQLCTVVFLVAIAVLPQTGVAMGYSQRYFLQILPLAALLAARRLESSPGALGVVGFAAVALGVWALLPNRSVGGTELPFILVALVATLAFLTLAERRRPRLALVGLGAFVWAWPLSRLPLDVLQPQRYRLVTQAVDWLREHPAEGGSAVVVTNLKLLDAHLARARLAPPLDVRCLIQTDNEYELTELTNPTNGQRARVLALASWRFYGRGLLARQFAADPAPAGARVVLQRDTRLGAVDPDTLVARGAAVLLRSGDLTILRLP